MKLWLQLLPLVLVAFNVVYATTSTNDPFRALALQVPKKQGPPICCLKPEPIEDEILLSFEEWKQQQGDVINRTTDTNDSDAPAPVHANDVPATPHMEEPQKPSPHFRVPITDRFNYASLECSARVHLSHRGAKSTSAILSSKRDRYMLSPCGAKNQFVVVELCEDIRIDTIQLANFEFFSGIFKDFKLSVAKTDITAEGAFTDAGVFRAKNIRGVQSFHPPNSLRDFYRYIRIDFLSHYGNEYYCPVSLLRVYGLTHLEQWKWDTWEQESRERVEAPKVETTVQEELRSTVQAEIGTENATSTDVSSVSNIPKETNVTEPLVATPSDKVESGPVLQTPPAAATSDSPPNSQPTPPPPFSVPNTTSEPVLAPSNPVSSTDASFTIHQPTSSTLPAISQKPPSADTTSISSSIKSLPTTSPGSKATNTSSSTKATSTTTTTSTHLPPSSGPGGESIYRTIMNRLTALEANHTLYARYVEQQNSGVREVLRRIGEDVGRLEGLVHAEGHSTQRALKAVDLRTQIELGELLRRVEFLADEIVLEKRLGVAQLCLLLAVMVFMGLTRGSRGDAGVVGGRGRRLSMREWSRRHLSFSGDWRFRGRGRKEEREDGEQVPNALGFDQDAKVLFPSKTSAVPTEQSPRPKSETVGTPAMRSISSYSNGTRTRSRTPSMRTRQHLHQQHLQSHSQHQHHSAPRPTYPGTPTRIRMPMPIPLQRSSSHTNAHPGGTPVVHRSARRWARTAHLHEVRSVHRSRKAVVSDENKVVNGYANGGDDPFWDGHKEGRRGVKGEGKENESDGVEGRRRPVSFDGDGDAWVDTDTDVEESDGGTEGWTPSVPTNTNIEARRPPSGNEH